MINPMQSIQPWASDIDYISWTGWVFSASAVWFRFVFFFNGWTLLQCYYIFEITLVHLGQLEYITLGNQTSVMVLWYKAWIILIAKPVFTNHIAGNFNPETSNRATLVQLDINSMNQFESTPIHYPMKSDQLSWWNSQSIKPYHNLIQSLGKPRHIPSSTTAMKISSKTQGTYEGWTLQFAQRGSKSPGAYLTLVRLVWMSPFFF